MEPYFRGTVSPLMDDPYDGIEIGIKISKLRESMCNLHSLQMKLKVLSLSEVHSVICKCRIVRIVLLIVVFVLGT